MLVELEGEDGESWQLLEQAVGLAPAELGLLPLDRELANSFLMVGRTVCEGLQSHHWGDGSWGLSKPTW